MSIEAWERFHEEPGQREISGAVPEAIAESWLRSREVGVGALDLQIPHRIVDTHSAFIGAAVPVLLGMSDLLVGSSTSLALTDSSGTVVWRWDSEPDITRGLDETEVQPGSSMHETTSGTSGIAVATVLRRPATVIGAQHYKAAWHRWACAASPVFHPVTQEMVGVINVACRAEDANHLLPVAARSMAREVQATLRSNATLPEQRLLAAHLKRRSMTSNPLVTVNAKTLIADDDGFRVNLDHAAIWSLVNRVGDEEITIGAGIRARVHRLVPGRLEAGVSLEILQGQALSLSESSTARSELEMAEMRVIRSALQRHRGNKLAAARELEISRGTLYNRIRRYRIEQ